jgi:hypothetical protein
MFFVGKTTDRKNKKAKMRDEKVNRIKFSAFELKTSDEN